MGCQVLWVQTLRPVDMGCRVLESPDLTVWGARAPGVRGSRPHCMGCWVLGVQTLWPVGMGCQVLGGPDLKACRYGVPDVRGSRP